MDAKFSNWEADPPEAYGTADVISDENFRTEHLMTFGNVPSSRTSQRTAAFTPTKERKQIFDRNAPGSFREPVQHSSCSLSSHHIYAPYIYEDVRPKSSEGTCCVEEISGAPGNSLPCTDSKCVCRGSCVTSGTFASGLSLWNQDDQGRSSSKSREPALHYRQNCRSQNQSWNENEEQEIPSSLAGSFKPSKSETQCHPAATLGNPEHLVPTQSKTILITPDASRSASRLSSPTPSDIPSPPPHGLVPFPSSGKVDVSVGVGTINDHDAGVLLTPTRCVESFAASIKVPLVSVPSRSGQDCWQNLESTVPVRVPTHPLSIHVSDGISVYAPLAPADAFKRQETRSQLTSRGVRTEPALMQPLPQYTAGLMPDSIQVASLASPTQWCPWDRPPRSNQSLRSTELKNRGSSTSNYGERTKEKEKATPSSVEIRCEVAGGFNQGELPPRPAYLSQSVGAVFRGRRSSSNGKLPADVSPSGRSSNAVSRFAPSAPSGSHVYDTVAQVAPCKQTNSPRSSSEPQLRHRNGLKELHERPQDLPSMPRNYQPSGVQDQHHRQKIPRHGIEPGDELTHRDTTSQTFSFAHGHHCDLVDFQQLQDDKDDRKWGSERRRKSKNGPDHSGSRNGMRPDFRKRSQSGRSSQLGPDSAKNSAAAMVQSGDLCRRLCVPPGETHGPDKHTINSAVNQSTETPNTNSPPIAATGSASNENRPAIIRQGVRQSSSATRRLQIRVPSQDSQCQTSIVNSDGGQAKRDSTDVSEQQRAPPNYSSRCLGLNPPAVEVHNATSADMKKTCSPAKPTSSSSRRPVRSQSKTSTGKPPLTLTPSQANTLQCSCYLPTIVADTAGRSTEGEIEEVKSSRSKPGSLSSDARSSQPNRVCPNCGGATSGRRHTPTEIIVSQGQTTSWPDVGGSSHTRSESASLRPGGNTSRPRRTSAPAGLDKSGSFGVSSGQQCGRANPSSEFEAFANTAENKANLYRTLRPNYANRSIGYFGPQPPVPPSQTSSARVRKPVAAAASAQRYQSKFHYYVKHQLLKPKKPHQTMGLADSPRDLPNDFLKKETNKTVRPAVEKDVQFPFILARPDAKPKQKEENIYEEARAKATKNEQQCERNYIKANIQQVCQSVPLRQPLRYVDTVRGDRHLCEPSGLEPLYVFRKDYGEVPQYLSRRLEAKKEKETAVVAARPQKPTLRYITEPERARLLEGLKENWKEMQIMFQGLPMMTDTVPKLKRKENLEIQLRQLEKDIAMIEQNPIIYIDERAGGGDCDASHVLTD